ncbi:MAG: sugar ABC transporter permease, partial [Oscillibacter sp.]|nr:sugar ABC transporter permease [Oscillibacter sp.]
MKKPIYTASVSPSGETVSVLTESGRRWLRFRRQLPFYLMMLIPLLFFLIFKYWSMFGVAIAFQDYKLGAPFLSIHSKWVGLKWFQRLTSSPFFGRWVRNTLLLSLYNLVVSFPISIFMALMLNEVRNSILRKFTSNLSLLPHFISTVVIVGVLFNFFSVDDGIVNQLIVMLGGHKIDFMGSSQWFRTMYVGSGVWQNAGFSAVVFTAAISGIDPTLYEAAALDGSTRVKNVFHITIPCILPTIITMFILRIGNIMAVGYEKIILMYSPSIYDVADTLSTYAYRVGVVDGKYSLSAAVSLLNSVCDLLL